VIGGICFLEDNEKSHVDPSEVNIPREKGIKDRIDILGKEIPKSREEGRPKAVRARARELFHVTEGFADLIPGKRSTEIALERIGIWVQISKAGTPLTRGDSAKETRVDIF
jgi:hypothetical protein